MVDNKQNQQVVITDLRERITSKTMQVGHITSGTFFFGNIGEYNSFFVKCGGQIMHVGTGNIMPEPLVFVNNYKPVRVEILIKEEITNKL
jgi:hypothetical protein